MIFKFKTSYTDGDGNKDNTVYTCGQVEDEYAVSYTDKFWFGNYVSPQDVIEKLVNKEWIVQPERKVKNG